MTRKTLTVSLRGWQIVPGVALASGLLAPLQAAPESSPLRPASPSEGVPLFTALTPEQSGIDFVNPIDTNHPLKRIYLNGFACGGVALGDLNGDSWPDLFLTSGPRANRVYFQAPDAPLTFTDGTEAAGITPHDVWSAGATLVDIDADGDLDIYVCNYDSPNHLWVNDGKGAFTEQAKAFGLAFSDASMTASFCDYDLDGDLDCYLLTCDFKREGGRPREHPLIEEDGQWKIAPGFEKWYDLVPRPGGRLAYINAGREDYLLRNEGPDASGQVKFADVSKAAGLAGRDRGNSVTWWDFDEDGLPDIYVANDYKDPDRLYRNNGDGTFTDVIRQAAPHTPWFSMGADLADLDGDGRTDFLIADMAGTNHYVSKTTMGEMGANLPFLRSAIPRQYMHNVLYLNTGVGKLADAAYYAGLASSDWTWAVKLSDFDLDGLVDVYFTNGVARSFNNSDDTREPEDFIGQTEWDYYESRPPRKEQNLAYANRGGLKFENVSKEWGLAHVGMSYGAATGDLDRDGDLELVVASLDEPVRVYRNNAPASAQRLTVRFAGAAQNPRGLGATVWVQSGGRQQVRTLRPATGFLSCNVPELTFGLASQEKVDHLTVKWQRGHVERFENLEAGHVYTLREPAAAPPAWKPPVRTPGQFATIASPSLHEIKHAEREFDDYARQPLLPYQHSMLGPGLAMADLDADDDPDFFLGGASGSPGRVVLNAGGGEFRDLAVPALAADAEAEDMGALFFDANRDGHLDLYVVSGSVECEPGAETLRDRLYLGDSKGALAAAPDGALPDLRDSGSCVAAADYDRDGDLDLFVGGRVIPGAYPETPSSRLLRNDSQDGIPKFIEDTPSVPGLEKAGLVTAALWSDANGDGGIDLLVSCEWGPPVKLFLNREGTLVEATDQTGVADHRGWWKGLAGADLDADGDIDYVVTNQGLNTPYKATKKKPELLFYGDFDLTGTKHIVEAKFEGDTCYPRRGLSCSGHAMPELRQRLKTFHNFASSTLGDLYGETKLATSLRLEANELASCVLLNDGSGSFTLKPLPRAAQMAPAQGVVLSDFDADGHVDCVLGQNYFGAQPEIGWFDSGLSLLLRGLGDGQFQPVGPKESGITVAGAATAVCTADLNGDARPDLVFALNHGPIQVYSEPGAAAAANRTFEVRLRSNSGNSSGVGARVTFRVPGAGISQTAEVTAGSGYLGQSEPALWFGMGGAADDAPVEIEVRWPDGTTAQGSALAAARRVLIER